MVGTKPNGQPDRRWVSSKSLKKCQEKLQELRQQFRTGTLSDPNRTTVQDFFTDWLENTVKVRRKPSTYAQYNSLVKVHLLPSMGRKPLKDVRAKHLDDLYRALEVGGRNPKYVRKGKPAEAQRGLAPKTIRGLHVAVHSGLERAVRQNLIPRNPADGVELPTAPRKRRMPVDLAQVQHLLISAAKHAAARKTDGMQWHADWQWATLWAFLANTGLRIGEALALRWRDVDLTEGWFTVSQNLSRGLDGKGAMADTKSESGERWIPLTKPVLAALREHKKRQDALRANVGTSYADGDLVFAWAVGTPLNERNTLRALKAAVKRADLPESTCLHDLRRMTASLLVAAGVDITTAAAILGHRNASVLLDVYAQALRAPKLEAATRLERTLYPALPG